MIYLDHNATTPVAPPVAEAIGEALVGGWGNPSSAHASGRIAKEMLESARADVARFLGCEAADLTFTSGATESNKLGIKEITRFHKKNKNHIVTIATEHKFVLEACAA